MSSGFVSESDIAERRKIRKEIWQSTKRDSDPDEPPEEPLQDHRSLFDRLKEQKDKKQEEWEEAHKLKNMVRGLEDDEVDFLEFVDNTKMKEEKRIREEELSAIQEYRKKVSQMKQKAMESDVLAEMKPEARRPSGEKRKPSQMSLLAGAIKRKKSNEDQPEEDKKRVKPTISAEEEENKDQEEENKDQEEEEKDQEKEERASKRKSAPVYKSALECVAILPGLGVYTDSSDSDNDSNSDSDLEGGGKICLPRDITGRIIHFHPPHGGQGCC